MAWSCLCVWATCRVQHQLERPTGRWMCVRRGDTLLYITHWAPSDGPQDLKSCLSFKEGGGVCEAIAKVLVSAWLTTPPYPSTPPPRL